MAHLLEPGEVFSMMGRQAKGQQLKINLWNKFILQFGCGYQLRCAGKDGNGPGITRPPWRRPD
jgi:hypothetical protein